MNVCNLLLMNHPGLQFMKQTDDFHAEWINPDHHWMHSATCMANVNEPEQLQLCRRHYRS